LLELITTLFVNGLLIGGLYALISLGLNLIWGTMKIINFAHGEFLMLGMYFTYWLFVYLGLDPIVLLPIVAPLLFLFGIIVQKLVIGPVLRGSRLSQIFATFGLSVLMKGGALFLWTETFRFVKTSYQMTVIKLGHIPVSIPRLLATISFPVAILLYVFLMKTDYGRALRATAQDSEASMLLGINVSQIYLLAFSLGTTCCGIAGALLITRYPAFPEVGSIFVWFAFLIVIMGGMGNYVGTFIASIVVAMTDSFAGYISPNFKYLAVYVMFIIVLFFKQAKESE